MSLFWGLIMKYTYEQIIQERRREYLEFYKEMLKLCKYIEISSGIKGYQFHYENVCYTSDINFSLSFLKKKNLIDLLFKASDKVISDIDIIALASMVEKSKFNISLKEPLAESYLLPGKRKVYFHQHEEMEEEVKKIFNSEVALELRRYSLNNDSKILADCPGDLLQLFCQNARIYSSKIHTMIQDYSDSSIFIYGVSEGIKSEDILDLFHAEFDANLFSEYFQKNIETIKMKEYVVSSLPKDFCCGFLDCVEQDGKYKILKK